MSTRPSKRRAAEAALSSLVGSCAGITCGQPFSFGESLGHQILATEFRSRVAAVVGSKSDGFSSDPSSRRHPPLLTKPDA